MAIQKLHVRFAIDRSGLVGADGPTHAGSFDITYLSCLPDFVVMAASDEAELKHMVATACLLFTPPSPRDRTRTRKPPAACEAKYPDLNDLDSARLDSSFDGLLDA